MREYKLSRSVLKTPGVSKAQAQVGNVVVKVGGGAVGRVVVIVDEEDQDLAVLCPNGKLGAGKPDKSED